MTEVTPAPPVDPLAKVQSEEEELRELLERVETLRRDIGRLIDAKVEDEKTRATLLPMGIIRQTITKNEHCTCAILRRFVDEAAKAEADT